MKRTLVVLSAFILAGLVASAGCKKKKDAPTAPAPWTPADTATYTPTPSSTLTPLPSSTRTRTPTRTPTRTFTPTRTSTIDCVIATSPTCTPTLSAWCPGSGTVGQYYFDSGGNLTGFYTYVTRIYIGASVSITAIQQRSTTTGAITQLVGLYTDNGSGTAPANLVRSMPITTTSSAWFTANITDYYATAGYYWLAVSSNNGTNNASCGGCYNCGALNGRIDGNMPASASNYLNNNVASAMLANWSCP